MFRDFLKSVDKLFYVISRVIAFVIGLAIVTWTWTFVSPLAVDGLNSAYTGTVTTRATEAVYGPLFATVFQSTPQTSNTSVPLPRPNPRRRG